jgi:acetolactate synthase-1/2/3 large subunit
VPTLEAAFAGGVQLVCVPVDYSENMRVLIDELRDAAMLPAGGAATGDAGRHGEMQ